MTSTTRFPSVFCHARRARLAALALTLVLAAAAAALAGCSQEGRTIQNALPVPGIAYDVTAYSESTVSDEHVPPVDTFTFTMTAIMDVRLKLQTVYRNGCEARGGLELRQIGPNASAVYVVTPLARYTADEACNVGVSGDTLQTITIRNLIMRTINRVIPADTVYARMQAVGSDGPPIEFDIRHDLATPGADSTLYDIRVEDGTTGLPLDGALVTVQRSGTPNILGEGTTAAGGRFAFSVASAGEAGAPGDPYVVKVSYAGRITLFRAIDFPSLSKRREAIVVHV